MTRAARRRARAARRRRRDRRGRATSCASRASWSTRPARPRRPSISRLRPQRRARHGARRLPTSYFGTGSDLMSIYDLETGERRAERARRRRPHGAPLRRPAQHRLHHVGRLPARRRAPTRAYLESFRAMVSNTTKPMVMTAAGVDDLEVMWKIACELRGGAEELRAKPYFIQYGEPVSPLQHAGRGARQAALLRRLGHPADLLAGADRRRHRADHARRPHRAGRGRVALRRSSSTSCAGPARRSSPAWARSSST